MHGGTKIVGIPRYEEQSLLSLSLFFPSFSKAEHACIRKNEGNGNKQGKGVNERLGSVKMRTARGMQTWSVENIYKKRERKREGKRTEKIKRKRNLSIKFAFDFIFVASCDSKGREGREDGNTEIEWHRSSNKAP